MHLWTLNTFKNPSSWFAISNLGPPSPKIVQTWIKRPLTKQPWRTPDSAVEAPSKTQESLYSMGFFFRQRFSIQFFLQTQEQATTMEQYPWSCAFKSLKTTIASSIHLLASQSASLPAGTFHSLRQLGERRRSTDGPKKPASKRASERANNSRSHWPLYWIIASKLMLWFASINQNSQITWLEACQILL